MKEQTRRFMQRYRCDRETALDYYALLEEGYSPYQSLLVLGLEVS